MKLAVGPHWPPVQFVTFDRIGHQVTYPMSFGVTLHWNFDGTMVTVDWYWYRLILILNFKMRELSKQGISIFTFSQQLPRSHALKLWRYFYLSKIPKNCAHQWHLHQLTSEGPHSQVHQRHRHNPGWDRSEMQRERNDRPMCNWTPSDYFCQVCNYSFYGLWISFKTHFVFSFETYHQTSLQVASVLSMLWSRRRRRRRSWE